uniref:Uncharacterized protein n=1 Tax=Anguilla anguilla TaxID=7936 RepID=A0A0E9UK66_ANGAN
MQKSPTSFWSPVGTFDYQNVGMKNIGWAVLAS